MTASSSGWLVPLLLGVSFTFLGGLKLYGLCRGYEGGPHKSRWERLRAGACLEEHCRLPKQLRVPFYLLLWLLFLGLGLYCLFRWYTIVSG